MEKGVLPPDQQRERVCGSVGQRSRLWRLQSRDVVRMLVVYGERLGAQGLQGRGWYHFAEGLGCCELQLLRRGYGGIVEQGLGSWGAMSLGGKLCPWGKGRLGLGSSRFPSWPTEASLACLKDH